MIHGINVGILYCTYYADKRNPCGSVILHQTVVVTLAKRACSVVLVWYAIWDDSFFDLKIIAMFT